MNKKLAEMSLLKLENFEKEVEFKKSLVSSLNERFLSGYNFIYLKDFVRIDLGLNEELIYEMGEFEETLKDPFFKNILFETKELDEDSRDIFYSIIFAIVLLSEELFNRNLDEDPFPVNFVARMFDILTVYTVLKTNKKLGKQVAFSYTGYNLETGWDNSIEFNFSKINPPTLSNVDSDDKQPAFGLNQKKLAGKYFQFAMLSLIFSECEPGSYGYRKTQDATERFLSDEYLLSFLIDNVKKYQQSDFES